MNIDVTCWKCGDEHLILVKKEQYDEWQNGVLIQEALPELSPDDRELLMSATCGTCWDKLYPDECIELEED